MKQLFKYALAPALVLAMGATTPALAQETVEDGLREALSQVELPNGDEPNGNDNGRVHDPVNAHVRAYKDRYVLELGLKAKLVLIASYGIIPTDGAAESDVIVKQKNFDQRVNHRHRTGGTNNPLELEARTVDSFNDNSGIIQANSDVGNMVNQGNVASVAVTASPTAFADANAAATQKNRDNVSRTRVPFLRGEWNKEALIRGSLNDNSGVIHFNQNSGDMNNQLNVTSLSVAGGSIAAMADSELGQFNTGNRVVDTNTQKRDRIIGSVNGNQGIVNVNQSSGKFNNQATVLSLAGSANIGLPTTPF